MTLPSPTCLVNGSPTPQDVPGGSTVNVALAIPSGANFWSLAVTSTDELNTVAAVAASLVVNFGPKTATFTAPATLGSAVRVTSTVGITGTGLDANGVSQPAFVTTFKINVLAANGQRVLAVDEKLEQNSVAGWAAILNPALRALAATGGIPLSPVVVNAASSPYAAAAFQLLMVDTTAGSVVINLPVLTSGQAVEIKHTSAPASLASNTLTINAPGAVTLEQSVPNNGTTAASYVIAGTESAGTDVTFFNGGVANVYNLK